MLKSYKHYMILFLLTLICINVNTKKSNKEDTKKPKKSILDYTDADMERLFDQWEVYLK